MTSHVSLSPPLSSLDSLLRAIANFWEWLSSLGLAKGSTVEPFGSVDNLIATLIRMKYLTKVTVPSLEQNTVFYRWGQRARREVSEKSVVTFLALVGRLEPNPSGVKGRIAEGGSPYVFFPSSPYPFLIHCS